MVNAQTSDLMFNMEVGNNTILEDNAQMIIDMLVSFNIKDIPTVDELVDDYLERE
jgi:hypothetical protein